MADPAPVAQTFFVDDDIRKKFRLDGIVTVVDAMHLQQHLDEEKPEGVENESIEQIAFADMVILNKCDLVENVEGAAEVQTADELKCATGDDEMTLGNFTSGAPASSKPSDVQGCSEGGER